MDEKEWNTVGGVGDSGDNAGGLGGSGDGVDGSKDSVKIEDDDVNHLLFDQSPAGAIACRREQADRLHKQDRDEREQRDKAASLRRAALEAPAQPRSPVHVGVSKDRVECEDDDEAMGVESAEKKKTKLTQWC